MTFGALLARIDANITAIGSSTLKNALVTLPTYFGHGLIGNSLTPLLAGGEIVLHPRGMPLINNLGSIIDEHEITFMSSVPSLWRLVLSCSPPPAGRSLLRVHVGSAPLSAAVVVGHRCLVRRRGRQLLWHHRDRQLDRWRLLAR